MGPIGTVAIMYRNNLSQMVIPSQLQQLISSNNNNNNNNNNGNNNNNNNNGNNNNNNSNPNNNNSNSNQNNNGNSFANSGNVENNNSPISNPTNSFAGSGEFGISVPSNGSPVSGGITANVGCLVSQSGSNIQVSLDLTPTDVPNNLQSTFSSNNDYLFNFDGTTSSTGSGTQITANAQGSVSGTEFNLNLNGAIDQGQDTFTFTVSSVQNSQLSVSTPQQISLSSSNSGNNNNNGNNNSNSPSPSNSPNGNNNNNNNSNGVNPTLDTSSSQINTATGKITLTFSITNSNSQDAKISKMSGTVINGKDQVTLGTVSLSSSVTISAGQTSQVVVSGTLTSQGKSDLSNNFAGATSIDVEISGGSMTVNGVAQSNSQTQDLGNINLVS